MAFNRHTNVAGVEPVNEIQEKLKTIYGEGYSV